MQAGVIQRTPAAMPALFGAGGKTHQDPNHFRDSGRSGPHGGVTRAILDSPKGIAAMGETVEGDGGRNECEGEGNGFVKGSQAASLKLA